MTVRPRRLHIVGSSPRSGTTLAFELITSCFDIARFGDHEESLFSRPLRPSGDYASKAPTELVHVSRVLNWDPQLFCLYMERDPRDILASRHGSRPGDYWCDFPVWERNRARLARIAPHPRLHICRYEDLVTAPDAAQARMAEAFPFLRQTRPFSAFGRAGTVTEAASQALGGLRPVNAESIGSWRDHLPRIAAQLHEHPALERAVIEAGYEHDPDWARILTGITPDGRASVRAQHDPLRTTRGPALIVARATRRLASLRREVRYVWNAGRA